MNTTTFLKNVFSCAKFLVFFLCLFKWKKKKKKKRVNTLIENSCILGQAERVRRKRLENEVLLFCSLPSAQLSRLCP